MTGKALLIIDMQNESFADAAYRKISNGVVDRINAVADLFRSHSLPVILIQHDGSGLNEYVPETWGWQFLDNLVTAPEDVVISKSANDSFYQTSLHAKLDELNITELYITGSATDFCIDSTIQSGLIKDFDITVVEDGHTGGDRPHLTGQQLIDHYNWVWGNLSPTKGKVQVRNAGSIIEKL